IQYYTCFYIWYGYIEPTIYNLRYYGDVLRFLRINPSPSNDPTTYSRAYNTLSASSFLYSQSLQNAKYMCEYKDLVCVETVLRANKMYNIDSISVLRGFHYIYEFRKPDEVRRSEKLSKFANMGVLHFSAKR
ncbi:hypothetical protein L9F63_010287, partial [Diploptera punctata]